MKSIEEAAREAATPFDGKSGEPVRPDQAGVHQRLNDATEYLHYACGLTELLAELLHEPNLIDTPRTTLTLGRRRYRFERTRARRRRRKRPQPVDPHGVQTLDTDDAKAKAYLAHRADARLFALLST